MNMAQPSVAREPSMEEILASIRRIIESNDPGGSESVSSSLPPIYDDGDPEDVAGDIRLTIDDEDAYAAAEMVAANDSGPTQASAPAATFEAVDPEKGRNISLADLAARVRSASERVERPVLGGAVPADNAAPAVRGDSPVMTNRMADLRAANSRSVEMPQMQRQQEAAIDDEAFETAAMADVEAATSVSQQDVNVDEPVSAQPVSAEPDRATEGHDLKALVSASTIEQVSRSFGELAAAIDGQQRRSLDEMAEEMLRPMLQEWLDDNLPTLVERLVREEIERVARGPRR